MGEVVYPQHLVTRLAVPAQKVVAAMPEPAQWEQFVVVGYLKSGEFYFAGSHAEVGDTLMLLEIGKKRLMELAE